MEHLIYPVIVAAVPLTIAALKAVSTPPSWLLPLLAPALGVVADILAAYLANEPVNPAVGAVLGGLGVWLREVIDQLRKQAA